MPSACRGPIPHPDHGYFFEFPVTEHHPDGTSTQGRIDLYRHACVVPESKQFQATQAAAETGVIARKNSSQPMRGTEAWDETMTQARGQAEGCVRTPEPSCHQQPAEAPDWRELPPNSVTQNILC